MNMIKLDPQSQKAFEHILMVGILKKLREENMLSDVQLNSAISKLEKQNTCTSSKIAV